ncbi:MAG: hypothetical protein DHS20C13_25000 [Thermodesulfobacteriota bacterium]|nr:MAG: hypothetical protein DHS20C13_25000 [Thermodesulfobacteriota bacterium]
MTAYTTVIEMLYMAHIGNPKIILSSKSEKNQGTVRTRAMNEIRKILNLLIYPPLLIKNYVLQFRLTYLKFSM